MSTIEELNKRLDRVKELMDVTGMSMEELMAEAAIAHVDCDRCPIKSDCFEFKYLDHFDCSDVWEKYLKGEFDAT